MLVWVFFLGGGGVTNERPGRMDVHTYGYRDLQTNSAQRAKLVKIGSQEETKFG